jgi:hypothetical protein
VEELAAPALVSTVVGKDVHDLDHLEEDEDLGEEIRGRGTVSRWSGEGERAGTEGAYAVTGRKELGQDAVEQLKLAARPPERVIDITRRVDRVLDVADNERVVADLPELHERVVEALDDVRLARLVVALRGEEAVLAVGRVDALLEGRHAALDDLLDLVGQLRLDVLLEPAEEEGPEDLVQAPDDEQLLLLVDVNLVARARVGKRRVEPLVKRLDRVEDFRQDKVEERPELGQVVLAGQDRRKGISRGPFRPAARDER